MSGTIVLYEVQDRWERQVGDLWQESEHQTATDEAKNIGGILIAHTYAWSDSELAYDFRPKCKDCDIYLTEEMEEDTGDQCTDCWESENTPQEGDVMTEDHIHFYSDGKLVVTVPDGHDWMPLVREWMEKEGFFPGVWLISDHGNAIPLSL